MVILWVILIIAMIFCCVCITDELTALRFEIRNLKDYLGRDGIIGELKKLNQLIEANDGKISTT